MRATQKATGREVGSPINLGSHKVAGVREAIEARGASLLYLPPYAPELNPIERVWTWDR